MVFDTITFTLNILLKDLYNFLLLKEGPVETAAAVAAAPVRAVQGIFSGK